MGSEMCIRDRSVTAPGLPGAVKVVSRADESVKEPPLLEVQA